MIEIEIDFRRKPLYFYPTKQLCSYQSYLKGESWLTSFGYRNKPPVDNEKLLKWGNDAKDAIKSLYGTEYEVGSAGATLYLAGIQEISFVNYGFEQK